MDGPIEVIFTILGVIDWSGLAGFCYLCIEASCTDKDIYATHNGWWPNIKFGGK